MMVQRCGGCVPSCLFLGATELKSLKKKKSTDKQIDLTVIWDTKSTKTDFLSDPKSVDRKTKNSTDEQTDSQQFGFLGHSNWLGAKVANLWTGGAAWKQVLVLYGNDRPALARHEF
jgi:hypothetical protein